MGAVELAQVRGLLAAHPEASRYWLSRELCRVWNWRDPAGQIKDMAARALLGKLHARGWIVLPARRCASPNRMRRRKVAALDHPTEPVGGPLAELTPLEIRVLSPRSEGLALCESLLHQYHYLSHTSAVGLNLKYLVLDRRGRPLSCLLFGSAAWQCAARDTFLGWNSAERAAHLQQITNNTRFLILPRVQVPDLAGHVLSQVLGQLAGDWRLKYARSLDLVETFVDPARFRGGCYRAANWLELGETTGRTRQDRWNRIKAPPKRVFVYPLTKNFRHNLRA
jgi:hypothetical protein